MRLEITKKKRISILLCLSVFIIICFWFISWNATCCDTEDDSLYDKQNVIIFSYFERESMFIRKVLSSHEDVYFANEPLDVIYSSMYGLSSGFKPIDLQFLSSGKERDISDYEKGEVLGFLDNFFNCDMENVPILWRTDAKMRSISTVFSQNYTTCIEKSRCKLIGPSIRKKKNKPKFYDTAHTLLPNICQGLRERFKQSPSAICARSVHEKCDKAFLEQGRVCQKKDFDLHMRQLKELCTFENHILSCKDWNLQQQSSEQRHRTCLDGIKMFTDPCLPHLTNTCEEKRIKALKSVQLNSGMLEDIIHKFPGIKIIHYVKDPRDIVKNRQSNSKLSKLAEKSGDKVLKELEFLCKKMLQDTITMDALEKKYPHTILRIKSEVYLSDIGNNVNSIYEFIKQAVPSYLLANTLKISTIKDDLYDNRDYKIPQATAWRSQTSAQELQNMTQICRETLKLLEYK